MGPRSDNRGYDSRLERHEAQQLKEGSASGCRFEVSRVGENAARHSLIPIPKGVWIRERLEALKVIFNSVLSKIVTAGQRPVPKLPPLCSLLFRRHPLSKESRRACP